MRRSFITSRRLLLFLAVVLLLNALFMPARYTQPIARVPANVVAFLRPPLAVPMRWIAQALRPARVDPRDMITQQQLLAERDRWQQEARRLEDDLRDARKTIEQMGQLSQARQRLGLIGVEFLPAAVTAWPASNDRSNPSLTINRGERDGVAKGQPVVAGFNLLGHVASVEPSTAVVQLLTKPRTTVGIRILPTKADEPRETITFAQADPTGRFFTADIAKDDPVALGDLAHVSNDTRYKDARGFVIGRIVEKRDHPKDPTLRSQVVIEPIPSPPDLDSVVVLLPTTTTGHATTPEPVTPSKPKPDPSRSRSNR